MSFNVEYIVNLRDKLGSKITKLNSKVKRLNAQMSGLGSTITGVIAGGAIIAGIRASVVAFNEQEQAVAQVRTGIETTGAAAGRTLEELRKDAADFQKTTLFGDENIMKGVTSQLLTFTNIAGKQFDRTQQAALDVTTRLFGAEASAESLKATSIQLGKALNDPTANMGALSRSGIQFSVGQKKVIKHLQATGRLADAQTIILDELQKQYGGSATAAAKAGSGGLIQFKNTLGDIAEDIGRVLMPMINSFVSGLSSLISFIKENATTFKIIGGAILGLAAVIGTIILAIKSWAAVQAVINFLLAANPIGIIVVAIGAFIGAIIAAWHSSETFRGVLFAVWEVIKGLGSAILDLLIEPLKALGEIWDGLSDLFSGKGIGKLVSGVKNLGKSIINYLLQPFFAISEAIDAIFGTDTTKKLEKFTGGKSVFANIGKDAEKGFQEGVEDFNKDEKSGANLSGLGGAAGVGAGIGKGLDSGIDKVTTSAPKVFNINIDALIKEFNIKTQNITESAAQTKDMVTQALIAAVNDVSIIDK